MRHNETQTRRIEGESDIAYFLFQEYLKLQRPRKLKHLAELQEKSYEHIRRYSAANNWLARAREWDREVEEAEVFAMKGEAARVAVEHMEVLKTARTLATTNLWKLMEEATSTKGATISARDTMRILKDAISLERLIVGQATDRTEARVDSVDMTGMSSGEIEQLTALLEKAGLLDE